MSVNHSISENTLVLRMAEKFGINAELLLSTLKATAFKQKDGTVPTNEEMISLLIVADQYGLNPFIREIYAYPGQNRKGIINKVIPVVSVDGWSRIINEHPQFDGMSFEYSQTLVVPEGSTAKCSEWVECILYRKDRSHPTRVREYLDENYRNPSQEIGEDGKIFIVNSPWQTHPKRTLRHKSMIQASRMGFGFTGIFDQDEAQRMLDAKLSTAATAVVERESLQTKEAQQNRLTPSQQATATMTHEQMNPILEQIAQRVNQVNSWNVVYDYVKERFSGDNLEYAKNFLKKKEKEFQEKAEAVKQAAIEVIDDDGNSFFS